VRLARGGRAGQLERNARLDDTAVFVRTAAEGHSGLQTASHVLATARTLTCATTSRMDALTHVPLDSHAQLRAHKPSFSSRCMTLCTGAVICATAHACMHACMHACVRAVGMPRARAMRMARHVTRCVRSAVCICRNFAPKCAPDLRHAMRGRTARRSLSRWVDAGAQRRSTSAPGLGSPLPHLAWDWVRPSHIFTGTALTLPHLHRDCAQPCHICTGTGQ
jgi:hypothetical protein